jgi:hypothetical protein
VRENKNNHKKMLVLPVLGLAALSSLVALGATPSTNAATSATTKVTVNVGSVIAISAEDITIDVSAPSPTGIFATGSGNVEVVTNDVAGYSVYLTSNDASTVLAHETAGDTIASIDSAITVDGTTVTKFATNNTWGWSNDSATFNPVVAQGTKHSADTTTLFRKTTTASATADSSTLTIGVTADSMLTSGTYTGTLLLTAVPNSNTTDLAVYDSTI